MSPLQENKPINVAILLYDQVEELDFCGPFEVFKSAAYEAMRIHGWEQPRPSRRNRPHSRGTDECALGRRGNAGHGGWHFGRYRYEPARCRTLIWARNC